IEGGGDADEGGLGCPSPLHHLYFPSRLSHLLPSHTRWWRWVAPRSRHPHLRSCRPHPPAAAANPAAAVAVAATAVAVAVEAAVAVAATAVAVAVEAAVAGAAAV